MADPQYFEVITDAITGEQTIRPYTDDEIAAAKKAAVPESVTPRQVRLLLLQQGLLQQVKDMIAASDEATQITWEFATVFLREDPLLQQMATNLGLTPEQVDQFFIAAAAL